MILGNRRSRGNIFGWKKIILNLPGSISYDSSIPWVFKKEWNNKIAVDLFFYIDDERPTTGTVKDRWKATQRVCQMLGYLGIQNSYRDWGVGWNISGLIQGVSYCIRFRKEVIDIQRDNPSDHLGTWGM